MSKKTYKILYIFMIMGYVLNFSTSFSTIGGGMKYFFSLIMLTSLMSGKLVIKKYYIILSLLFPFAIIPMILMIIGKYRLEMNYVLTYSLSYLLFVFLSIAVIELFSSVIEFCKFTNYGLFCALLLNIIISRELSLNVYQMLINILGNTRTERALLGFVNPNTVGLIAAIGLVLIISQYFYIGITRLNMFFLIFYLFIIINTGSRTALLSPIIGLVVITVLKLARRIPTIIFILIMCILATFMITFIYYKFVLHDTGLKFGTINQLTSSRLERQLFTLDYLKAHNLLFWGIGNLNSTALYSNYMVGFLNTDNSPIYFVTTIGVAGLVQIIIILVWLFSNIDVNNKAGVFCSATLIMSSLFEHTLFVSSSLFSLFFLCIIFISINEKPSNTLVRRM